MTSTAAPGQPNEDFVGATSNSVVVLDGAGMSGVDDGGCGHGVSWYSRTLGGLLLGELLVEPHRELAAALGHAIRRVADSHRDTCDLNHPGTPSSTVAIIRVHAQVLEYLVIGDSVVVVDTADGPLVVVDLREAEIGRRHRTAMDSLGGGSSEHTEARRAYVALLRENRNRPGGFWVAAADPVAATHALTGSVAIADAKSVTLLSDGASRVVDRFGLKTWPEALSVIAEAGPTALIRAVRSAEFSDPNGRRWPRGKIHDDASIAYCDQL